MKKKARFFALSFCLTASTITGVLALQALDESKSVVKEDLVIPNDNEIVNKTGWKIAQYEYLSFMKDLSKFPVSFTYNNESYKGFDERFSIVSKATTKENEKESTIIVLNHEDEFQVTLEAAFYINYGAYEWTINIENTSKENTGIFSSFNACDINYAGTNPHLKGMLGDQFCQYYPFEYNLLTTNLNLSTNTGRSNEEYFPYFNLETDSGGALIALGWPGNWEADFNYSNKTTNIKTRQKDLYTYLKPNESIRSPLTAIVRYGVRDEDIAMNAWRHWFIDCNMPRPGNTQLKPQVVIGSSGYTDEMVSATEDILINALKTFANNGLKFDYWWMDAGWYVKPDNTKIGSWMEVGTWEVDKKRFPTSFKAISDYAKKLGTKTLLWFEPETIRVDLNELIENFNFKEEWAIPDTSWGNAYLTDMANAEFRQWLLDRVNKVLQEGGISLYREDFNVRPASAWKSKDQENRIGLYENQYICGHFEYWDGIVKANPNITLDSCASGGNRNDIETLRRAIPMHVSDSAYGETGVKQSMFYQLYKWIPYFGIPATSFDKIKDPDTYMMRNNYCASVNMQYFYELSDDGYQKIYDCIKEYRQISNYLFADYYPVTEYSRGEENWMGWEFFDEQSQKGYVQLFRQDNCLEDTYKLKLKGLDDNVTYLVKDFDGINTFTKTGKELKDGFLVKLENVRSAYIATIEKI